MSTPTRRPVIPKLGSSFLTRQLSLQSPTPPIQPNTQQHRKQTFRRQSSEDLSLRRGRRRGRDTPPATPSAEKGTSRDSSSAGGNEKRAHTASSDNSDVRWHGEKQNVGQNSETILPVPTGIFNRHFPSSKDVCYAPSNGPIGGRPITPGRPRTVRVAWVEKRSTTAQPTQQHGDTAAEVCSEEDLPVEVIAKKVGQPKPITGSVLKAQLARPQQSLPCITGEKDSVYQTRQQLADKLRRAWWGEDQLRPNLDIFLACAVNDNLERTSSVEDANKEEHLETESKETPEESSGKVISIKIDTSTIKNNSSSADSSGPTSPQVQSASGEREESTCKISPRGPNASSQNPTQLHSQTMVPAKGGEIQTKYCPSNETKAPNSTSGHAAENKSNCSNNAHEKTKEVLPSGGCNWGKENECPLESQPQPLTSIPAIPHHQPSISHAPTPTPDQSPVTNDGSVPSQTPISKNISEVRKDVVPNATKQQSISANDGKGNSVSNASLKRAQFRNSSLNRKTITRSAEVNCLPSGADRAPTGGSPLATNHVNVAQAPSSGTSAAMSTRISGTPVANHGNFADGVKVREDAAKGKRVTQQGQEVGAVAAERNPWKRNADSAGITRASTIDVGESSQSSGTEIIASGASTVQASQTRPSTALRPADRSTIRPAASFVTAAAARHRQKASSKRRTLRRFGDDDEGAEGEGCADDLPKSGGGPRGKGGVRGALADVVTMVSLVSPTGSDTEEPLPEVFSFPRDPAVTAPAVPTPVAISSRGEGCGNGRRGGGVLSRMLSMDSAPERSSQRKLHKSVSFQSDVPPGEECFTRRLAFPASLIIPRVSSSTDVMSLVTSDIPLTSNYTPSPPAPAVICSNDNHVPIIVNPSTRNPYTPPDTSETPRNTAGRPSTAAEDNKSPEAVGGNGPFGAEDSGIKSGINKKRVMFRARSSSLRGSADHNEERGKIAGDGTLSSHELINNGNNDGNKGRAAGPGDNRPTSVAANASKQRDIVVILPERRERSSQKIEENARGCRTGPNLGNPRSKGTNNLEKGNKEETESDAVTNAEDYAIKVPDFKSPKERECWELYQRMCEKGLSVSYDTILRGMLTPTEYRMRRNALLSTC